MPRKRVPANNNRYYKPFPSALRKLMEESKTKQQTLADALGVRRQTISYYCDGSSSPDWEGIVKIANFFSVSTDWLLGISEVKSQSTDIKSICTYTGLSEIALTSILRETQGEDTRTVLNVILGFDPSSFHRFIKNAAKGIEIQRKYMNKPFNWDLVPKEIRTELFDYFDIDPDGIENIAERTRERYFNKAINYLKMVLLEYLISPTGKPLIEYGDEENVDGID